MININYRLKTLIIKNRGYENITHIILIPKTIIVFNFLYGLSLKILSLEITSNFQKVARIRIVQ